MCDKSLDLTSRPTFVRSDSLIIQGAVMTKSSVLRNAATILAFGATFEVHSAEKSSLMAQLASCR